MRCSKQITGCFVKSYFNFPDLKYSFAYETIIQIYCLQKEFHLSLEVKIIANWAHKALFEMPDFQSRLFKIGVTNASGHILACVCVSYIQGELEVVDERKHEFFNN